MSYCRWSSRCFDCDLYVYECVHGGWKIHVAGSRRHSDQPRPKPPETSDVDAFVKYHMACSEWVEGSTLAPIGLEHDGETFVASTAEEAAATVSYLGEKGYRFPDHVISTLLEEHDAEG